jgi:hypothetical protein
VFERIFHGPGLTMSRLNKFKNKICSSEECMGRSDTSRF